MTRHNIKGFTLVELVVVLAIIGVLSAVLIPGIVGYMKDSRISAANQNAQTVFLAMSAWHAKYVSDNDDAGDFSSQTSTVAAVTKGNTAIDFSAIGTISPSDMRGKLSENFFGSSTVMFSTNGESVMCALWSAGDTAPAATQLSSVDQEDFSTSNIIGCFPLA